VNLQPEAVPEPVGEMLPPSPADDHVPGHGIHGFAFHSGTEGFRSTQVGFQEGILDVPALGGEGAERKVPRQVGHVPVHGGAEVHRNHVPLPEGPAGGRSVRQGAPFAGGDYEAVIRPSSLGAVFPQGVFQQGVELLLRHALPDGPQDFQVGIIGKIPRFADEGGLDVVLSSPEGREKP